MSTTSLIEHYLKCATYTASCRFQSCYRRIDSSQTKICVMHILRSSISQLTQADIAYITVTEIHIKTRQSTNSRPSVHSKGYIARFPFCFLHWFIDVKWSIYASVILVIVVPFANEVAGYTGFTLSVRPPVQIVYALYLLQY